MVYQKSTGVVPNFYDLDNAAVRAEIKAAQRWKRKIGLRHLHGDWVTKADHDRLQPQIDEAAANAADATKEEPQ